MSHHDSLSHFPTSIRNRFGKFEVSWQQLPATGGLKVVASDAVRSGALIVEDEMKECVTYRTVQTAHREDVFVKIQK